MGISCIFGHDWEEEENKTNFKYKKGDFQVSWYKYIGRGMEVSGNFTAELANDVVASILVPFIYIDESDSGGAEIFTSDGKTVRRELIIQSYEIARTMGYEELRNAVLVCSFAEECDIDKFVNPTKQIKDRINNEATEYIERQIKFYQHRLDRLKVGSRENNDWEPVD